MIQTFAILRSMISRTYNASVGRNVGKIVFGMFAALILLGSWQPLYFLDVVPEPWMFVLSEAASGRYAGTQFAFTHGPLSDVMTRLFNPATFVSSIIVVSLTLLVQVALLVKAAERAKAPALGMLLLVALYCQLARDMLLLATPVIAAFVAFGTASDRKATALTLASATTAGLGTLAKFTLFPISMLLFLLVDFDRIFNRQFPVVTFTYVVGVCAFFAMLAPEGNTLSAFLSTSVETIRGYAEAMSIDGPIIDYLIFGALSVIVLASAAQVEWRRAQAEGLKWDAFPPIVALLAFVWFAFKLGFVRHSLQHTLPAFAGLALVAALYGATRIGTRLFRPSSAIALTFAVLASSFYCFVSIAREPAFGFTLGRLLVAPIELTARELGETVDLALAPREWLEHRLTAYDKLIRKLASESPIAALEGTVDTIPGIHSNLIAAGIDYRPRPTVQEYTTYTKRLVGMNRAHFLSNPPDHLVFVPFGIDNRHPALVEGPLWPLFLSHYAPSRLRGGWLVLTRRPIPLGDILKPFASGTAAIGEPIPLSFGSEPLFVRLDVRPTWLGSLVGLAFKPPELSLVLELENGSERRFRLVPSIAQQGFVAWPLISMSSEFVHLAAGIEADQIGPRVRAMRIAGGAGAAVLLRSEFKFSAQRIDRAHLNVSNTWQERIHGLYPPRREQLFRSLAETSRPGGGVAVLDDALFASAPQRLTLQLDGARSLRVAFGLLPGSWQFETDGVCFRVLNATDDRPLWEQCIDPAHHKPDRRLHWATISLPEGLGRVVLETSCRADCNWDQSYWYDINPSSD